MRYAAHPDFSRISLICFRASLLRYTPHPEEVGMLWILAAVMGGLGLGYVVVRRKRKATQKA